MTAKQAGECLSTMMWSREKVAAAVLLYGRVVDPENIDFMINDMREDQVHPEPSPRERGKRVGPKRPRPTEPKCEPRCDPDIISAWFPSTLRPQPLAVPSPPLSQVEEFQSRLGILTFFHPENPTGHYKLNLKNQQEAGVFSRLKGARRTALAVAIAGMRAGRFLERGARAPHLPPHSRCPMRDNATLAAVAEAVAIHKRQGLWNEESGSIHEA